MAGLYNNDGFIVMNDSMGSDLTVVNAARVSFGKRKERFTKEDKALIEYLAKNEHWSPFRHCTCQFHIKAPEFVARQMYKHVVGASYAFTDTAWNEVSGRYIELGVEMWSPNTFRKAADNVKQGSTNEEVESPVFAKDVYWDAIRTAQDAYTQLIDMGVCKEQARAVLPVAFFTEFWWTASLQAVAHFIRLRSDPHAQAEIRELAEAMRLLVEPHFPVSLEALLTSKT